MTKALRVLSFTSLLMTGVATATFAAGSGAGAGSSQTVTGTQLGSPQESRPATGSATTGAYGMNNQNNYPGAVGPTGSRQPDATNPARSSPSGGGGMDNGGGGSGGTGSSR